MKLHLFLPTPFSTQWPEEYSVPSYNHDYIQTTPTDYQELPVADLLSDAVLN